MSKRLGLRITPLPEGDDGHQEDGLHHQEVVDELNAEEDFNDMLITCDSLNEGRKVLVVRRLIQTMKTMYSFRKLKNEMQRRKEILRFGMRKGNFKKSQNPNKQRKKLEGDREDEVAQSKKEKPLICSSCKKMIEGEGKEEEERKEEQEELILEESSSSSASNRIYQEKKEKYEPDMFDGESTDDEEALKSVHSHRVYVTEDTKRKEVQVFPEDKLLAMDCECVNVEHKQVAGEVAIVNGSKETIYHKKIRRPQYEYTDACRIIAGFGEHELKNPNLPTMNKVKKELDALFKDKVVLVFQIPNTELAYLDMKPSEVKCYDIQEHFLYKTGKRASLWKCVKAYFKKEIQLPGTKHSASEDAIWTMRLYQEVLLKGEHKDCAERFEEIPNRPKLFPRKKKK